MLTVDINLTYLSESPTSIKDMPFIGVTCSSFCLADSLTNSTKSALVKLTLFIALNKSSKLFVA
jgi:hypothetical protein